MVKTEINITCSALTLLKDGADILAEVEQALRENNNEELEDIAEQIDDEETAEKLCNADIETIMEYITISEDDIELNHSETAIQKDREWLVFRVPVTFNDEKFAEEN